MKVKCISGSLQESGKVRYTLVSLDNDLNKIMPQESNIYYLDAVDLTIGKNYEVTVSFQEIVPQ